MLRLTTPEPELGPQAFRNGEIHDWYRTVWGYSDHLVASLLDEFRTRGPIRILDPFCGSGTTLVECSKRGIDSAGIDANPVSCMAARVKTNWRIQPERLRALLDEVRSAYANRKLSESYRHDKTFTYLDESGMLERGWISVGPLRNALAIKSAIRQLRTSTPYREAMMLALLDTVVRDVANVKFGPELFCIEPKRYVRIFDQFARRVAVMVDDLVLARAEAGRLADAIVLEGDARRCDALRPELGERFSHVICSPPYPTEHDYTRNSRLELALIERVSNRETLREIKMNMVRSHTKGIYALDQDAMYAARHRGLARLAKQISSRAEQKSHGFAKLYARVTLEYFGGMARHLRSIRQLLRPNAILAYVVGDQSSYLQVPIATAKILADLAEENGYDVLETRHWRDRLTRSSVKIIEENILILRRR